MKPSDNPTIRAWLERKLTDAEAVSAMLHCQICGARIRVENKNGICWRCRRQLKRNYQEEREINADGKD